MTPTVKTCFKCGNEKPIIEFYRHKRMADGRLNKCKSCTKKDVAENRKKNVEYYREFDRSRANMPKRVAARLTYSKTPNGISSHKKANNLWQEKHPLRKLSSSSVNNALRDGKLKRLHCFVCGSEKTQGHHADYKQPLAVIWLCAKHHAETHNLHRLLLRNNKSIQA